MVARQRLNENALRESRKLNRFKRLKEGKQLAKEDEGVSFDEFDDAFTFLMVLADRALNASASYLRGFMSFIKTAVVATRQEEWDVVVVYIRVLKARMASDPSAFDSVNESLLAACRHTWECEKKAFDADFKKLGPCYICKGAHHASDCPKKGESKKGLVVGSKKGAKSAKAGSPSATSVGSQ